MLATLGLTENMTSTVLSYNLQGYWKYANCVPSGNGILSISFSVVQANNLSQKQSPPWLFLWFQGEKV